MVVPAESVENLRGARLEWSDEGEGGLVLVNPNAPAEPDPAEGGVPEEVLAAGLTGPLASRVMDVLETMVNPSIAAHGGRADLVALDEGAGVAYLQLSGGCQGCAMSRMTLTQGIETALRQEVPELVQGDGRDRPHERRQPVLLIPPGAVGAGALVVTRARCSDS